jgi:hypothetical protein
MATSERKKGFKMRMHEVVKGITIPSMNELMNVYMCHYQQQNIETKMRLSEALSLTLLQTLASHYEPYFHRRGSKDRVIAVNLL